MHFRFVGTASGVLLQTGHNLEIPCGGPHSVVVQLRRASDEEVQGAHSPETTFCVARSEWEVSDKNREAFDNLAKRQLPKGWNRSYGWESQVDEEGRFLGIDIVRSELLPQSFQDFARKINKELTDAADRSIAIVRWRSNQPGPHNPLAGVSFTWSMEGNDWHHMPSTLNCVIEATSAIRARQGIVDEIVSLLNEEHDEPIGHKLFREAWKNRLSNRRSSLLIGIAAVEVGFKHFVTALVPATNWLVENIPSPSIVKMLSEYLPVLPAKQTIAGKVLPPPKAEILDVLTKGVTLRNKVTHTSADEPKYETLEEILLAVRDVLWLLDYYRGYHWALNNIRPEVRDKLFGVTATGQVSGQIRTH